MEMLLMGMCVAVFGMGIAAVAFGAATRSESPDSAVQPALSLVKADAAATFSRIALLHRQPYRQPRLGRCRLKSCCCRLKTTSAWSRLPRSRSWHTPRTPCCTAKRLHRL